MGPQDHRNNKAWAPCPNVYLHACLQLRSGEGSIKESAKASPVVYSPLKALLLLLHTSQSPQKQLNLWQREREKERKKERKNLERDSSSYF